jgi:hypothetical protein
MFDEGECIWGCGENRLGIGFGKSDVISGQCSQEGV